MTKPIVGVTTFDNLPPPWQTAQLDANFVSVENAVNDMGTYSNPLADTSGSPNAITVPIPSGLTATYVFGLLLYVKVANTTTSGTVTLAVDGLGPQNVFLPGGGNLQVGALVAGGVYPFMHDGTNFQMVGWIPPSGVFPGSITVGGGITAGAGGVATLSSNGSTWTLQDLLLQGITGTGAFIRTQDNTSLNLGANGNNWWAISAAGTLTGPTLNATTALQLNSVPVAQVPLTVSSKSSNYTLVQSDTGSMILCTASLTITVPNLAVGSVFVIIAASGTTTTITGSGVTLQLANGTLTTGNRTVTGVGQATVAIPLSGFATVSGGGVT